MNERRRWKINFTIQIFNFAVISTSVLFLVVFYALWKIAAELQHSPAWQIYLIVVLISLTGFFLALPIMTYIVLHRTLGPIPRMERILEKIISGEYSLRINVRKKDIIRPFVDKLNKVLQLLEEKAKS